MAVNYFDFDLEAKTYNNGNAVVYENDDAIKNSVLLWLTSSRGDFLKNPDAGGMLDFFLFKNITTERLRLLGFSLYNEMYFTFLGLIKILDINIVPNYTQRYIQIEITYQIIESEQVIKEELIIDKPVNNKTKTYIEIDYIEENLYNFVKIQKNSHQDKKLKFDTTLNSWIWGEFKLVNLTESDPYFAQILELCNVL